MVSTMDDMEKAMENDWVERIGNRHRLMELMGICATNTGPVHNRQRRSKGDGGPCQFY